jgi:hypothetical protein
MNGLIQQFEYKDLNEIKSNGLWNGKAGMAIVYCLLMRHTNSDVFTEKALALLDDISDNIRFVRDVGFAEGITGIGWAIQWLADNEFLDINTDEALGEIDDSLYRTIVFSPDEDISMARGTLGKAIYFTKRHQSVNEGTVRFKAMCRHECLVLLTNDLKAKLAGEQQLPVIGSGMEENVEQYTNWAHALLFLSSFIHLNINLVVVEDTLYSTIGHAGQVLHHFTDRCREQRAEIPVNTWLALQYLAFCYYMAGKQYNHRVWQQQGKQFMQQLNAINSLAQPKTPEEKIRRYQIDSLLHTCMHDYRQVEGIAAPEEPADLDALPFTFHKGSGMALLSMLSRRNPELVPDWHQLIL